MTFYQYLLAFCIGLLAVFYAIPVIVRISTTKKLFDEPNDRKLNIKRIPNLGGIALFLGISIGTLLGILNDTFLEWRYILSSMIIMFFIGIKDDILVISARKKLIAQLMSAVVLIFLGDIRITNFNGMLGIYEIDFTYSVIFSIIVIVGIINALNLIDGIDGLASSISFLAACSYGAMFYLTGHNNYVILCAATAGSLISFFGYNVFGKVNKIFMGDTGSLILGLIFSVCAIRYNEIMLQEKAVSLNLSPVISLAILSIPIFDTLRLFAVRLITRKSPFSADMNHIHHKILRFGLSHLQTTLIISTINLLLIIGVFYLRDKETNVLLILLVASLTVIFFLPDIVFELMKRKPGGVDQNLSNQSYAQKGQFENNISRQNKSYVFLENNSTEENPKKKVTIDT